MFTKWSRTCVSLSSFVAIIVAASVWFSAAANAKPSNDNLSEARLIAATPFTTTEEISAATQDPGDPSSSCGAYDLSVWFKWVAPTSTGLMIDTTGSTEPYMAVSVYSGAPGELREIACDAAPTYKKSRNTAQVYLGAIANQTYFIKVSLKSSIVISTKGATIQPRWLTLNVDVGDWPNDNFADAIDVDRSNFTSAIYNNQFTTEPNEPKSTCAGSELHATAWYRFTPESDIGVMVHTESHMNAVVAAFAGSSLSTLTQTHCWYDPSYDAPHWRFRGGTTYYFQVSAAWEGVVNFRVDQSPIPSNDNFADATSVTALPFSSSVDTTAATSEASEPWACDPWTMDRSRHSVWYRLTLPIDTSVRVDLEGNVAGRVAIYKGHSMESLSIQRCGSTSQVLRALGGQTYFIHVYGVRLFPPTPPPYGTISLSFKKIDPPAGDAFSQPISVDSLPFLHSNNLLNATAEELDSTTQGSTIWYKFDSTTDTGVVASFEGSEIGVEISVFTKTPEGGLLSLPNTLIQYDYPKVKFRLRRDVTYYFRLTGSWPDLKVGNTQLSIEPSTWWPNRLPGEALPLQLDVPLTIDTSELFSRWWEYRLKPSATCRSSGYAAWYQFTVPSDGGVSLDVQTTDFPQLLSVHTGSPDDLDEIACSPSNNLSFAAKSGTTYYLRVGGLVGCDGEICWYEKGSLRLTGALVAPPSNDEKTAATPLTLPFVATPNLAGATRSPQDPQTSCGPLDHSVWYSFVPNADIGLRFSVTESFPAAFFPRVAVFVEEAGGLKELSCGAKDSFRARLGKRYWFAVGGLANHGRAINFSVDPIGYPPNDDLANALSIPGNDWVDQQQTEAAGLEDGELRYCSTSGFAWVGRTIWYRFNTDVPGPVVVTTEGSSFDTVLSVFEGDSLGNLRQADCNNDNVLRGSKASVQFVALPSKTYYLRLGGLSGQFGTAQIRVRAPSR